MRPSTRRVLLTGLATSMVTVLLASCGASGYCTAVEKHQTTLDAPAVTTASFTALAEALRDIGAEAPNHISDEYDAVATAVERLLEAESATGVPIEELTHGDVVDLSEDDTAELRNAYQGFNDTSPERRAIAEDIAEDCDLTLMAPA